jgi:membrane-associated phospholipid phosphatase
MNSSARPAFAALAISIRTNWRMKAALTVALTTLFSIPYFTLQHRLLFPVRTLPVTTIDRAIGFDPSWVWVYQSVYLLLVLVPWMAAKREELKYYATGFIVLCTIGFLCFFLMPVRGPRPDSDVTNPMFRLLVWYDRPLNCFPSLHVGLAVYTMLVAAHILDTGALQTRTPILSFGWLWTALVAYAAVATKQHYAVDLAAGVLLACGCHLSTWHFAQRSMAHAETPMGVSRTSLLSLVGNHDRGGAADASLFDRSRRR